MTASSGSNRPHETLERVFHEPGRLAIMSAVCAADDGTSFTDLKETCGLTDGNLNRHLKVLEAAGVVKVRKAFVLGRPRTTVFVTRSGITRFNDYLEALGRVLNRAREALPAETRSTSVAGSARPVTA